MNRNLIGAFTSGLRKVAPAIGVAGLFYLLSRDGDEMKICFLDVGDGHCTHVQQKSGTLL